MSSNRRQVMRRLSRLKSRILEEIERNQRRDFFGASVTQFRYRRGTGNRRRRSQNGFYTPMRRIRPSVEVRSPRTRSRRVHRSFYLQLQILGRKKSKSNSLLKNRIEIKRKNHNRHITTAIAEEPWIWAGLT